MAFDPIFNDQYPLRIINFMKKYMDIGGKILVGNRVVGQLSKLQVLDFFYPGLFVKEITEAEEASYDYITCIINAPRKQGILSISGSYKQKISEIEDCLLGNKRSEKGYRNYNAAHNILRRAASDLTSDHALFDHILSNLQNIYTDQLNDEQKTEINTWMNHLIDRCSQDETIQFCTADRTDGLSFDRAVYDSLLEKVCNYKKANDYSSCWIWLCLGSLFGNYVSGLLDQNSDKPASDSIQLIPSPSVIAKPGFCGRDEYLKQIDEMFRAGNRVIFLYGIGGIGKTEIARQYASAYQDQYDVIIYAVYDRSLKDLIIAEMPFETKPAISRLFTDHAKETDEAYFNRKLEQIKKISDQKTLIILDNFNTDGDENLISFLNGRYRVLITTQYDYSNRYPSIKIKEIEDPESLISIFMNNYQGYAVEKNDPDLIRLIHSVSSHTFTIVLLAHHMENSGQTPAEMMDALTQEGIASLNETVTGTNGMSDEAYLNLIRMFKVFEFNEEEQYVLKLLSLIFPVSVPPMVFKKWADLPSTKSMLALEKRGWILRNTDGIALHSVVCKIIQHIYPVNTEDIHSFLNHVSESIAEEKSWHYTKAQKEQYCRISRSIIESVNILDENTVLFYQSAVVILGYSGYPEQAVDLGTELYEYRIASKGLNTFETAHIAYQIGWIYLFNPHLTDALDSALSWLSKAKNIFDDIGTDTAAQKAMYCGILENISKAYSCRYTISSSQLDLQDAERYAEEAVKAGRKWLNDSPKSKKSLAGSLLRLADVDMELNVFEKSEDLINEAHTLLSSMYSDNDHMDPDILRVTSRKARVLYHLGKYHESLMETEKNLIFYQKFYDLDNPSLFDQMILKIKNCMKLGYADLALQAKQEAYSIGQMIYTSDSPKLRVLDVSGS